MEVIFLKNDGRCLWLERKVLKKLIPEVAAAALNPNKKTMYLIEDWISNDCGKVGADLKWLKRLGVPLIKTFKDLPEGNNYAIVNTGYDSIVAEEKLLLAKGIDYIDMPCPYIRKIRRLFENIDENYQYMLLCEPNHIIIKNFKSIYPDDLILVQMDNYQERILNRQNGKPLILVPYVTFLPFHVKRVFNFINENFFERTNKVIKTSCMWIASPSSPVVEINNMSSAALSGVKDALLIASAGTSNKSVVSLIETLENKGLQVIIITSLPEFISYEKKNRNNRVLLVRSPIPNNAEKPVVTYIKKGLLAAYWVMLKDYFI